jgi:hypothetical protein
VSPLTEYQDLLHSKIKEMRESGLGYRRIAYWLNDNGYKTPRHCSFLGAHVFSILKKRRLREERINKPHQITYGEWFIKEI